MYLRNKSSLPQILREMFTLVEKSQLSKMRVDMANAHAQQLDKRPLRHQMSTDNMNAPPFNIPNLRVEQRKTSSAEDMARKNSTGHLLILLMHYLKTLNKLVRLPVMKLIITPWIMY